MVRVCCVVNYKEMRKKKNNLEVRARNASWNLLEERLLNLDELGRFRHIENLFNLTEEHHLFLRASFGPVLEQATDHLLCEWGILLKKLDNTVGQLGVVERQALDLVQRQQDLDQKLLVFHLQRQGESIDNATHTHTQTSRNQHEKYIYTHTNCQFWLKDWLPPENLQKLADTVKVFRLINESASGEQYEGQN